MPTSFAIFAPAGFAAIAVNHIVEDKVIPAIEDIIKNEPSFLRVPFETFEPLSTLKALIMGNKTPERAVLLGNAGAISISAAMTE
jgi:hypothetical protein